MKHRGILIVVSGFSGAGKGTLMKGLLGKYENYALSVSMTTRAPRPGEKDGESYFFVDRETFERAKEERQRRAAALGRGGKPQKREEAGVPVAFHMKPSEKELDDPYRQAEYLYSLIESEG